MLVMLDVVANHVGYWPGGSSTSSGFQPFNRSEHYHACDSCPDDCNIGDFGNQDEVEICRLAGLPDLNQSNAFVAQALTSWVTELVREYSFDGLRIDTVCEVEKSFWGQFREASGVFTMGEVDSGDPNYVSQYQSSSAGTSEPGLDATLSYPLFFTLRKVGIFCLLSCLMSSSSSSSSLCSLICSLFSSLTSLLFSLFVPSSSSVCYSSFVVCSILIFFFFCSDLLFSPPQVFSEGASMYQIQDMLGTYESLFPDTSLLGTFIDNHDNPRFLSTQGDRQRYKSAVTFTLMTQGIPIVYYGTEQWLQGGDDPGNREAQWGVGYSNATDMYSHIKTVLSHRSHSESWKYDQIQRYADDQFYAFTRGDSLVCVTNMGTSQDVSRTITYHSYPKGTRICNIFYSDDSDCIIVDESFDIYLMSGESKVYTPK